MHPALERLNQLAADAQETETAGEGVTLITDAAEDAAWSCAKAMPALIAALVEIEQLIKRHHLESGSVSDWDDGYSQALKNIQAIIKRHVEPLK